MSLYESLSIAAQLLTAIAVTSALVFAASQARAAARQAELLQRSLKHATYSAFEQSLLDMSKTVIANCEVRPYFYEGKCINDQDDVYLRDKVAAMALYFADYFDHVITTEAQFPGATDWPRENWNRWIQDMLRTSPILKETIKQDYLWYNAELLALVERVEDTPSSEAPNPQRIRS